MLFDKEGQIYTDDKGNQWRIGQRIYLNPAWGDDGKVYNPTPFHLYHFLPGEITKIRAYKDAPVKVYCLMYAKPKDVEFIFSVGSHLSDQAKGRYSHKSI